MTAADSGGTAAPPGLRPILVAVNVGSLSYRKPDEGAAAHGGRGALVKVPSAAMNLVLEIMRRTGQAGHKLVACLVLTSTMLQRADIKRAVTDFAGVGYECQETHGVRGVKRPEKAGVMVCVDTKQLRFLRVGSMSRYKRVVRRGRVIRVRLGVLGAPDRSSDFNVLGAYMPQRGVGARGHADDNDNAHIASVWGSLANEVVQLARRGRLVVLGDLNAELPVALRWSGRVARPADGSLAQMYSLARIQRIHGAREWTYTATYEGRHIYSVIDHVFVSVDLLPAVAEARVVDGVETGTKRHRALQFTLLATSSGTEPEQAGEARVEPVRVCQREPSKGPAAYEQCKATYFRLCAAAVEEATRSAVAAAAASRAVPTIAQRLVAIQDGTASAMAQALLAGEGATSSASSGSGTGGARVGAERRGQRTSPALLGKQRAAFLLHALSARQAAIGRMRALSPQALAVWDALFLQPGRHLVRGVPHAYGMFHSKHSVAGRIRHAYGMRVRRQMLDAGGGQCATAADVAELMHGAPPQPTTTAGAVPTDTQRQPLRSAQHRTARDRGRDT